MGAINPTAYIILIARLIVSAAFIFAALPKIQDPISFASSVEGYQLLTGTAVLWVALLLPWLELVIGAGLFVPQMRRGSALIVSALLLLFIGLHTSAWIRGLDIECGCFGEAASGAMDSYLWLILRNTALLMASLAVLMRDWKKPDRMRARPAAQVP